MGKEEQTELATLISLQGKLAGERFELLPQPNLIGANPNCQIKLNEPGSPDRAALIELVDNKHILSSLDSAPIMVNNKQLPKGINHVLVRGDIISIGASTLRFVAPGEVFSLEENVSDRVIDRKPSKTEQITKLLAITLAVVCLLGLIFHYSGSSGNDAVSRKKSLEARTKLEKSLANFIAEGDRFFREGRLNQTTCSGENCSDPSSCVDATECYQKALELDPKDLYAQGRLKEIEIALKSERPSPAKAKPDQKQLGKLLLDAQAFIDQGHYVYPPEANAKETYLYILQIDPENKEAKDKLAELQIKIAGIGKEISALLSDAQNYIDKEQFISPKGQNAYDTLQRVLGADKDNEAAMNAILDMAAYSIYQGNLSREQARAKDMLKWYETAESLGVDPEYLAPLKRGANLIEHSKSAVVVLDLHSAKKKKERAEEKSRYLDTGEIQKRVSRLKASQNHEDKKAPRVFIDLSS